jgi:UDP-N-acetylglucosamine 1-carboxyvinyltransferase
MPDRIVAATYLSAVAASGGEVELLGADSGHLSTVVASLREAGCSVESDSGRIRLKSSGKLHGIRPVRTAPYPGFPTDAQAVLMAALLRGRGTTVFVENMFENRYRHVGELCRLGADVRVEGRVAVVCGVERLRGAAMEATDLRGGAAMVVAALAAEGESRVGAIHHIRRGYEDIVRDLRMLGAEIAVY